MTVVFSATEVKIKSFGFFPAARTNMFFLLSLLWLFFFCSFSHTCFFVDSDTNKLLKTQQGFTTSCIFWEDAQNLLGFWREAGVLESMWKPRFTWKLIGGDSSSVYSWLVHNCCTIVCQVSSLPIKSLPCSAIIEGRYKSNLWRSPLLYFLVPLGFKECLSCAFSVSKGREAPLPASLPSQQWLCTLFTYWQKVLPQLLLLGSDTRAFSIC